MVSRIKYLSEDMSNAKPLFDVSNESKFDVLWETAKKVCKSGQYIKFFITQKDDKTNAELLFCWFAVFTNDNLTLLWQGTMKGISSVDNEMHEWRTVDADVEKHLSTLPNNKVFCYQNGNDVRFLTPQEVYIGTLETEIEDWKSHIYL